jgi:fatty-acyl-CoA synthase
MKIPLTPLRCLYRAVDLYGRKEAIICGEKRFSYAQFGDRCERLTSALENAGVIAKDRVGFLSFNTHRLLEGYFAAPMARAIVMPLNVRLTPFELEAIIRHAEPRILFYESDFAAVIPRLCAAHPALRVINLDTEFEDFLATGEPGRRDFMTYDEDEVAELFYTSGSTGTPKGVMLSHRALYLHAITCATIFGTDDVGADLHTIPLFHANGWGRPQSATMFGLKQVMVRRFDPAAVCRLIEAERCTAMCVVPTMAHALLNYPGLKGHDYSSLDRILIGGAAASQQLVHALEAVFGCRVSAGYGMTETAPVATSARPKSTVTYADDLDRETHQAMAGWPAIGVEVRVVDADMQDVPRDMTAIGEVVIRSDNVMEGYYREPEATAAVMSGPWIHTGDMAVWDEESFIHIVDRKKDIIISGGENISSIEVENTIAAHPAVLEAAVVSAPSKEWGEIPVALVVTRPGQSVTQEELVQFLGARLAKFKTPRQFVFHADPLPKGGTGKVLKKQLREPFWQGKERRVQG